MYHSYNNEVDFSDLLGKTIISITGAEKNSEEIVFTTSDGFKYYMLHQQNCCENVYVEDITGDISDLLNGEIVEATEASQDNPHASESGTWTFYKLNSNKWRGGVCIRWNGESNGYYSEGVSFYKYKLEEVK